jgi:hypothetical protein
MNRPLRRSRINGYQLRVCVNFIADEPARRPRPEDGWRRVPGQNMRGCLAVRPRVTVIREGRDAAVREIDTDSSNPAPSANMLLGNSLYVQ